MQRIKIRFLADYQHLCKIPTDSSQTLHEIFIHNAITFLNSVVRKLKANTVFIFFCIDFHENRIQLTKHFSTYFCNYGRCCLAILKMKIFFEFLIYRPQYQREKVFSPNFDGGKFAIAW